MLFDYFYNALYRTVAFSVVKPYSSKIRFPGAEAPHVSMVKVLPAKPTYFAQPKLDAASIAKRFVIVAGKISSL
ncbi:phosphate transport system permease protein pstA [Streptococcus agalactiae H36B]|nr:phosphate transport system permease protein pstA [Streptococcus agalactiae H36B]